MDLDWYGVRRFIGIPVKLQIKKKCVSLSTLRCQVCRHSVEDILTRPLMVEELVEIEDCARGD